MIIQFTVGNFLSFKDKMTFSLAANKDTEHQDALFSVKGEGKFIKTAAIYGLNASGKSNFIKALRFFRDFVNSGFASNAGNAAKIIPVNPFLLNEKTEKQPSFFEAIILINGEKFVYGFEVSQKEIHREWLYRTPGKKRFFTREKQQFDLASDYKEGPSEIDKITREDVLVLTNLAKFNGALARKIVDEISKIEILTAPVQADLWQWLLRMAVSKYKDDEQYRKVMDEFVLEADFGIEAIKAEYGHIPAAELTKTAPDFVREFVQRANFPPAFQHKISATHKKFDAKNKEVGQASFDFSAESHGTLQTFVLSALFAKVIIEGGTLIIDEINSALHPMICRFILFKFNSKETNPKNAVLLFTTHDVSLLDKEFLRRDQAWFVDKNRFGASEIFSLDQLSERKDVSYSKRYLEGRYGAIPYIKALEGAK